MTIEKLNRLAELSSIVTLGRCLVQEEAEYRLLLNEWKKEQENKFDFRTLKFGDVIQSRIYGISYVVIAVSDKSATAIRTIEVTNDDIWLKIS